MTTFNDDPDAYRDLILAMVISPGHGAEISPEEFLRRIHVDTKEGLTGKFLARSIHDRSAKAVGLSMIVSGTFGFSQEDLPLLHELACADWHRSHEDVVAALGRLGNAGSVASLLCNINRPADQANAGEVGAQSLTAKTIRSLGRIEGPAAEEALRSLASSEDEVVREAALHQLERRRER
jgi:hypothetical protein